jgi:hypothetical protein
MSLKAFHLVFVTASVLLMLGIAGWCVSQYLDGAGTNQLVWATVSLACAAALLVYGRIFLKKLKHISYL